ncbi:MAG: MFS transporter [Gammaproteobacteria bacterium]|nr:MFS transporter [Gammaproteobacteria bacterium]
MSRLSLLVLLIGFGALLLNSGSRFAIGVLLKPMAEDMSWSRSAVSSAVGLFMLVTALGLPLVGRMVDRLGALPILAVGAALSALGIATTSLVQTPLQATLTYGLLFALGSACTSITPVGVMVTTRFPQRTGFANSVAISGMGVGQLLIIAVLANALDESGWREAFLWLGLCNLLLLPLVALAAPRVAVTAPTRADPLAGGEAVRSDRDGALSWRRLSGRRSLLLFALYGICGFQDFFVATHVVAHATDQGIDNAFAGNLLATMGLFGLVGVLLTGGLTDRSGPLLPTGLCFALRALLFMLILLSDSTTAISVFALLYGATFWVTAPLTVIFVRQIFGLQGLGTLTGLVTMVHHVAGGLGAWFGARVFDSSGDYRLAFIVMLVLSLLALLMVLASRQGGQA